MKNTIKILFTISLSLFSIIGFTQNIGINSTGLAPNTSAGLDIDFTNKGFLAPRIALTGVNDAATITTPATSLLIYNTNAGLPDGVGYYYNSGTPAAPVWVRFMSGAPSNDWTLLGNSGTNPTTNFIGTTDAQDWVIRTNNTEKMRVQSGGNVGIGTATPTTVLNGLFYSGQILNIKSPNNRAVLVLEGNDAEISLLDTTAALNDKWMLIRSNAGVTYFAPHTDIGGQKFVTLGINHTTGNVGIGTVAPIENLDVIGDIRASGTAYWGGAGTRTETRNDAGLMGGRSGFYQTSVPAPAANWPIGATSWWHLLDVRHTNTGNNFAMQFAGSFWNQDLYFRKTANNPAQPWSQILTSLNGWMLTGNAGTTSATNFIGTTDAQDLVIRTNNTEKMRVQSIGNVGIGTTTPVARLDVRFGSGGLNSPILGLNVIRQFSGEQGTTAAFIGGIDAGFTNSGIFVMQKDNFSLGSVGSYTLNVVNNGVSQMLVNGAGNVGVGTTTPTYKLHVIGKIKTDNINETSDSRLKKDIVTIDNAITKVEQLRGVFFNWRTEEFKDRNFDTTLQMGVIAQEIEKIIPEVVNTDGDGYKSVEYSKLVGLLIEAIKEQQKTITNLETRSQKSEEANEKLKTDYDSRLKKLEELFNLSIEASVTK